MKDNATMEDDEVMAEIRQIRARLYEETKDLSDEEHLAKIHAASERVQDK